MVIGESAMKAAPFFESAGRPSQPFWGPQQGNKLVLWESLSEEKVKCWEILQQEKGWTIWCRAQPGKKKNRHESLRSMAAASSRASASRLKATARAKKKQREVSI